ncbi:MAG: NADH-quinone oxidoreductase subunit L [Anaerolineales bacterium]|nr:NADH-quinone oxidoreductase subunit L [Anaerolineales bacterium]
MKVHNFQSPISMDASQKLMFNFFPLLFLFPLVGLLLNVANGRFWHKPIAGIIASSAAGLSFAVAILQWVALLRQPDGTVVTLGTWLQVGNLDVPFAFQIDTLSVTMMLVVTGIGTLIHLYAIGYMRGDPGVTRFFVYLNLFLVAMLLLVSAANYPLLFVGWEGVGLCSYLLIGFWFDRGAGGTGNASAGRKAFVVNRVGDLGLILAMGLLFWQLGTLTFDEVFAQATAVFPVGSPLIVAITLLLLLGAAGKSAQIPLFIWLPDAMAGPTPVSALIHAATMVTAGIYLIARSHVLFALAPVSQTAVSLIGASTALLAATIATAQFDIKRVLAYSTISQLGFMVAAVGMGAYVAGIFHLITHAFFKALLFLAAGSVIHGLEHGGHSDPATLQDMGQMGGLRQRMPITFAVYLVGALALAGIPPLAGFFSKDEILAAAGQGNWAVYIMLTLAAFATAFYMGRQVWLVFMGEARSETAVSAHESPPIMTIPLLILAALAIVGGGLNLPGVHTLGHWLGHTLGHGELLPFNATIAFIATLLALLAVGLAYWLYGRHPLGTAATDPLTQRLGPLFVLFNRGWWVNEMVEWGIKRPFCHLSTVLAHSDEAIFAWAERQLIHTVQRGTAVLRRTQTGQLNWNVAGIIVGLLLIWLLLRFS